MKIWWMVALLAMGSSSYAHEEDHGGDHGGDQEKIMFSVTTDESGNTSELSASVEQVAASPAWDGLGNPPMGVGAATEVATEWMKKEYAGFTQFVPERIELAKVFSEGAPGRWSYTIMFSASGELAGVVVRHQFTAVVLLDGTVIKPKVYKEKVEGAPEESGAEGNGVEAKP